MRLELTMMKLVFVASTETNEACGTTNDLIQTSHMIYSFLLFAILLKQGNQCGGLVQVLSSWLTKLLVSYFLIFI